MDDEQFSLDAQAGTERVDGRVTGLRDGSVVVYPPDVAVDHVTLLLDFGEPGYFELKPDDAVELGTVLRAHAALAQRALPWQADEEPSGKPSKVRHGGLERDGGWVQVWTPWPPPDPPQVWLIAGVTVVLDFAQAVALAQALEDAVALGLGPGGGHADHG